MNILLMVWGSSNFTDSFVLCLGKQSIHLTWEAALRLKEASSRPKLFILGKEIPGCNNADVFLPNLNDNSSVSLDKVTPVVKHI